MSPERTERWKTAYHEAGHAFIANYIGLRVRDVRIFPDDDKQGFIDVSIWEFLKLFLRKGNPAARHARHLYWAAGIEAQEFFHAGPGNTSGKKELSEINSMSMEEAKSIQSELRDIFDIHRNTIMEIASRLHANGHLTGNELLDAIALSDRLEGDVSR
jgi:hypothetical protein